MVNLLPTILYSCMIGMTLLALLELFKRPNERQYFFLKALFGLMFVHLLGELFIYSGAYVYAPGIAGMQMPFRILLGPMLFFYAHAAMSSEQAIDKKAKVITVMGPVIVITIMLPFIFMITPAEKLALASPETRDPELWRIAVLTCLSSTIAFIVYTLYFLVMALKQHTAHREQLMERYSDIEKSSLDWFRIILMIWGAVWLMYAVEFSLNAIGWRWFGSGIVLPIIEVAALAVFTQQALSQKVLTSSEKSAPKSLDTKAVQTRTALLSEDRMQRISTKLEQVMKEEQLFLLDDLSLKKLSESIGETENHISETLSQFLQTNFFQFVNGYRIEAAKKALENSDKQITGIAFDVGFNSKSTFNTAFKKFVGHSPSAYRKLLAEQTQS